MIPAQTSNSLVTLQSTTPLKPRLLPSAAGRAADKPSSSNVCVRAEEQERTERTLLVCINKTCKKQGSREIARFAGDLALPGLRVETTGCLGKCGAGPNLVLTPEGLGLSHVATPARLVDSLAGAAPGLHVFPGLLKATELRLAGNARAREGDLAGARDLYTAALEASPDQGSHLALSNRAGVRLGLGDPQGAAEDAGAAAARAPPGFHTAYVRQAESLSALERYEELGEAMAAAAARDPSFAASPECRSVLEQLAPLLRRQRRRR